MSVTQGFIACQTLTSKNAVPILFNPTVNTWWLQNILMMVQDGDILEEMLSYYNALYEKTNDPETFTQLIFQVYKNLATFDFAEIKSFELNFINHVLRDDKLVDVILNSESKIGIIDESTIPHLMDYVKRMKYGYGQLIKIRDKLTTFFRGNDTITDVNQHINVIVSEQLIPDILKARSFDENIHILAHSANEQVTASIIKTMKDHFEKIDIKTNKDLINTLKTIKQYESHLHIIKFFDITNIVWKKDVMKYKKWNNWFNKNIYDMYHTKVECGKTSDLTTFIHKLADLKTVAQTIHHIADYDKFLVSYLTSLTHRIKSMMFDLDTFRNNYNLERVIIEAMYIADNFDIIRTIKKTLTDALKSYHLSVHLGSNPLLIASNAKVTADLITPPAQILNKIDGASAYYYSVYPHRSLCVSQKNTIVALKCNDTVISGTLIPMSILFVIANDTDVDHSRVMEKLNIKDPLVLSHGIKVLEANNLVHNYQFVPPTTNVILREHTPKTATTELNRVVQQDRISITRCYIVKMTKHNRHDTALSKLKLFAMTKCAIKYFDLEYDDFSNILDKLVENDIIYMSDGFYRYDEPKKN